MSERKTAAPKEKEKKERGPSGFAGYRLCAGCSTMAYCHGSTYEAQFCALCRADPKRARRAMAPKVVTAQGEPPDPVAIAEAFEELAAATGLAITRIARIVRAERNGRASGDWPELVRAVEAMERRFGCKVSTLSRVARARRHG